MLWILSTACPIKSAWWKDLPSFVAVRSEALHNAIQWQIDDEEGVCNVCQQEGIETLCLEVLDKKGRKDLHIHQCIFQ